MIVRPSSKLNVVESYIVFFIIFLLVEVPEGILVDFGNNSTDEDAQKVFDEAVVNDVTEMRDLVDGYRSQNMFLNQEVLGL